MKVVLHVLTVMSLTKGAITFSGCQSYPVHRIFASETSAAGTSVYGFGSPVDGLEWSVGYDVLNNYSDQLRDYYRGALRFFPATEDDTHRCVVTFTGSCALTLTKTLDAEVIAQLAGSDSNAEVLKPRYAMTCSLDTNATSARTLTVKPVNEFVPEFSDTLRNLSITELARRNTVITNLKGNVYDKDCFLGGDVKKITLVNGTDWIRLNGTMVVLSKDIQFEELVRNRQTELWFQLSATDSGGRVGRGMLIVGIEDVDNHPPYFSSLGCERLQPQNCSHPFYTASVSDSFNGDVFIAPAQILAEDGDIMRNDTIRYSFLENDYAEFVEIDGQTGTVRVVVILTKFRDSTINFTVVATEDTDKKHHSTAKLVMHVMTVDVGRDNSTTVMAFTLSVVFIIVVGVMVVMYLTHRQKVKRQEETRQREQEENRPMDDLHDLSSSAPGETQDLTSSQPSGVTESSTDPDTFESVSEATSDES